MRGLRVFVSWLVFCASFGTRVDAGEPKPILFYQPAHVRIYGDEYSEIEFAHVRGRIHDEMLPALAKIFGVPIVNYEFKARARDESIARACAATGAIGAIETFYSIGNGKDDTYRAAFTIAVRDCTGGEFFSETAPAVHGPGRADMTDVAVPAMEAAIAQLSKDVENSPKASGNFIHFGFYMTDAEMDSFWLPDTDGKKTTVESCDPVGTAYRAGLREDDEVRSIDGVPTVGIDVDALNSAMAKALKVGSWTLEVVGKDKLPRTLTFQNQTVAWYAAHPLSTPSH